MEWRSFVAQRDRVDGVRLVYHEEELLPLGTLVDELDDVVVTTQRLRVDWPQGVHTD